MPNGACTDVQKFDCLELMEEIEILKRAKNSLTQEMLRLSQEHKTTEHELHTFKQRLKDMELHQQQMISFFVKAMQNPGFFAQILQQNENWQIVEVNKKRRLPLNTQSTPPLDGQMVKYQPLINEAARAMLMQLMNTDWSHKLDTSSNGQENFVINLPSLPSLPTIDALPDLMGSTSSSQVSQIQEKEPNGIRPTMSGIVDSMGSSLDRDSLVGSPSSIQVPQVQEAVPNGSYPTISGSLDSTNRMIVDRTSWSHGDSLGESKFPSQMSLVQEEFNGNHPTGSGNLDSFDKMVMDNSLELDGDDGMPNLPGINDVFWEQFFAENPFSEDAMEMEDEVHEIEDGEEFDLIERGSGGDTARKLEHLTKQLELLTSEKNAS
ncbi:hypothetical protein AMTR_s00176p00024870 [Amborella trichopoda]|uniref:HSF-type DNA-binding domain-containing protein n=2 Tax=Amborella trichopoda TaxID=13333 RepID=W1PUI4_AMBTC|nr:hypothetical protein AMTR_s00176p00024870 [Amborella trichopoda]